MYESINLFVKSSFVVKERVNDDSDDESTDPNVFDVKKIYWDNDGNLRHGRTFVNNNF